MKAARIIIAGLKGGSGKTTVSVGLIRALALRGLRVSPFKKGPDFIDPGWLSRAANGAACYALDPFLIGQDRVLWNFIRHFGGSDCAVIEGNRGLFDGMDAEGSLSTGQLAHTLKAPVLLIIDCTKMTRTAAALVTGVLKFDPRLRLSGVVLNRIAGARHEDIIRRSIKKYCPVPVLGAIPRLPSLGLPERHMGLTPHEEHPEVEASILRIAGAMTKYLDLDGILKAAQGAPPLRALKAEIRKSKKKTHPVRIGIMRDSAFQFYYPDNFEALEERGAELVYLSPLRGKTLPDIDALYIGGGFPETHAIALAGNRGFKESLKKAVGGGLPVYAECGGLMYLGKSLLLEDREYPMASVLPVSFTLHSRPQAHGYTVLKVMCKNPFYKKNTVLYGHEFHYSGPGSQTLLSGASADRPALALRMLRGVGISEGMDGILFKNVLATYTHVHALGTPEWADGMIRAAKAFRAAG